MQTIVEAIDRHGRVTVNADQITAHEAGQVVALAYRLNRQIVQSSRVMVPTPGVPGAVHPVFLFWTTD